MIEREGLPEIQGWFVPRVTPEGTAPEAVRRQWVDVPLPLRSISEKPNVMIGHNVGDITDVQIIAGAAKVLLGDAVKALRIFEQPEAARYWDDFLMSLGYDQSLGFRPKEGQLYVPSVIQRILPGIETFDQL